MNNIIAYSYTTMSFNQHNLMNSHHSLSIVVKDVKLLEGDDCS